MTGIAVFDFDGTVIRGDSVVALLLHARKQGLISPAALLSAGFWGVLYGVKLTDALTSKQKAHAFLAKLTPEKREAFLRDFAAALVRRAFPDAIRQIRLHHEKRDTVLLCSASCHCYMRYVAPLIGADALLCTPCTDDGQVLGPNCRGQEKVRRVYAWLDQQSIPHDAICAAYGDSGGDAPILRASQNPVLVNAKKKLKKLLPNAQQVEWKE